MKHEIDPAVRLTFWGISPDVTDERGRELFKSKFGKQPAEIIRYPKCVLLLGPIVEDVGDSRSLQYKKSSGGL
jgi:hypothetical protein